MLKKALFIFFISVVGLFALIGCSSAGGESTEQTEDSSLGSAPVQPPDSAEEGPASRGAASTTSDVAGVCLSAQEAELARQINAYRAEKNLPPVPVSKSLTLVAQQHVWDSTNNPQTDSNCNLHSWSANVNPALQEGTWSAVCYTSDHANAAGMWNKPREIAGYQNDGIENSFWSSGNASATDALNGWKNSPGHNAVITEQNGWGPFLAMGIGMSGNFAHLWFGRSADPAGEAQLCSGGSITPGETAEPTKTVVPTATEMATTAATNTPEPTATTTTATDTPEPTAAATATNTAEATAEATTEPTSEPTATTAAAADTPEPTATTAAPATGEVLNVNGTVAAGGSSRQTFDVANGQNYTITVQPAANFDSSPSYVCNLANGSMSGNFDIGFDGQPDSTSIAVNFGNGSCTVTVEGFGGSSGSYTLVVTSP